MARNLDSRIRGNDRKRCFEEFRNSQYLGLTRLTGFSLNKGSTAVFGRRDVTTPDPSGLGVAPLVSLRLQATTTGY